MKSVIAAVLLFSATPAYAEYDHSYVSDLGALAMLSTYVRMCPGGKVYRQKLIASTTDTSKQHAKPFGEVVIDVANAIDITDASLLAKAPSDRLEWCDDIHRIISNE